MSKTLKKIKTKKKICGRIYKIMSSKTKNIYIGSTKCVDIQTRLYDHRHRYYAWLKETNLTYSTSYEIVQYKDAKIKLIEKYYCNTRQELFKREQYYFTIH
jgi:hypothetical protein